MFINNSCNKNNTNFRAFKVASVSNAIKNRAVNIDLYKLNLHDRADREFLTSLQDNLKIKISKPTISETGKERWQKILNYCIYQALESNINETVIAVAKNKLCGILTYMPEWKDIFLDGLSSIPNEHGEKIPLTGKTLMLYLFRIAQTKGAKAIGLDAVPNGPFDAVKFYENLGFKKGDFYDDGCGNQYQTMSINKYHFQEQKEKLQKNLKYKDINDSDRVNLLDIIG